jgi:aminoglycoside phosphotransferase (APT) family kinase protein
MSKTDVDFEAMFGDIIGEGAQATVYAKDDVAVKLYRKGYFKSSVFFESHIMAMLEEINFPSPKVFEVLLVNGRYGLCMERVKGRMVSEYIRDPETREWMMNNIVELQCRIQQYEVEWAMCIKSRYRHMLKRSNDIPPKLREELLEDISSLPDGNSLLHCDFHPYNIFYNDGNYMIIDLAQISRGDPAADAACSYMAYSFFDAVLADNYLDRYCAKSGIPGQDVLRWLRVYAGTLLGQVPEKFQSVVERFLGTL